MHNPACRLRLGPTYPQFDTSDYFGARGPYDGVMRARVIALRRRGRRIRDGGEGVVGELQLHSILVGSVMHRVAELHARAERGSREDRLLEPLYEPELVAIGADAMLIRGYESGDGTGYVQEWHCGPPFHDAMQLAVASGS